MNEPKSLKFIFPPILRGISIQEREELFPVGRIYCVGRNYEDHAKEMNSSVDRDKPFFFSKPPQAITQRSQIPFPTQTENLHHEVELVVCLKSKCAMLKKKMLMRVFLGTELGLILQKEICKIFAKKNGKPWDLSKGFDNSAPISKILQNEKT